MKYDTLNLLCSKSSAEGLGRTLSTKHLPLGRTNLVAFKRPGFKIGLAGTKKSPMSSECSNGRIGSILAAGKSEVTKLLNFLAGWHSVTGVSVTRAALLALACMLCQRLLAEMLSGRIAWGPSGVRQVMPASLAQGLELMALGEDSNWTDAPAHGPVMQAVSVDLGRMAGAACDGPTYLPVKTDTSLWLGALVVAGGMRTSGGVCCGDLIGAHGRDFLVVLRSTGHLSEEDLDVDTSSSSVKLVGTGV